MLIDLLRKQPLEIWAADAAETQLLELYTLNKDLKRHLTGVAALQAHGFMPKH